MPNAREKTVQTVYNAALYVRLSRAECGGAPPGDNEISNSIQNQLKMLRDYVSDKPEISVAAEIKKDECGRAPRGISGITFDRPGFNLLMKKIRNGEINCVIVKDNSRLGRNFTEVERYTDIIFPTMGVRYISLGENIDSIRKKTFNERIATPVTNLANEHLLAETSRKTRNSFAIKRKLGEFINNFAVYGY